MLNQGGVTLMIVIDQFQCMINVTYLLFLTRKFALMKTLW